MTTPERPDASDTDVLARLDRLEELSRRRSDELRQIAAELPAVVGRRAMIRSLVGDTLANPHKAEIVRRVGLRLSRVPIRARNELRHGARRLTSRARSAES